MDIIIAPTGDAQAIYSEVIELAALGRLHIRRASHVEPDEQGSWFADLAPVSGPKLGPFAHRSQALVAELAWLTDHLATINET